MTEKFTMTAPVVSQRELAPGIFSMIIEAPDIAEIAQAGQFLLLYCDDRSRLLPRPLSICRTDRENGLVRLVYRTAGSGTKEFSAKKAGDTIRVTGPSGNGFPLRDGSAIVIGGGIGIPPMLELSARLDCKKKMVLGYRDGLLFLKDEFERLGDVYTATEDGSFGTKGTVLDAIRGNYLRADVIYACGPVPMLRAVRDHAAREGIECYVSLEEKMACGIGACLACVCKTRDVDSHTNVHNARICAEGPVFRADTIEF